MILKSKLIDFGYPDYLKMINELYVTFSNKTSTNSAIKTIFYNENGTVEKVLNIGANNVWDWKKFSWSNFSYEVTLFDKTIKEKLKLKKVIYLQLEFSNEENNKDLAIKNLALTFRLLRRVK